MFVLGCSSSGPELAEPIDVQGDWTADFLVNTSDTTTGKEVSSFGDLTLGPAAYESSGDRYNGGATLISTVYAPQGSLDNPTMDAEGEIVQEQVGTVTLRGTWDAETYDGVTSFELNVNCEEIKLSAQRPDLMAVCGAPGFDTSVNAGCRKPDGATTLQCQFGAGDIVFHRK